MTPANYNVQSSFSYSGYDTTLGVNIKLNDLQFYTVINKPVTLNSVGSIYYSTSNITSSITSDEYLPLNIVLGIQTMFYEHNVFAITLRYQNMSYITTKQYQDVIILSLGGETKIVDNMFFRYGMYYEPRYDNSAINTIYFTTGIGYEFNKTLTLNLASQYGKRNYKDNTGFYYPTQYIDETLITTSASLTIKY